MKDIQHRKDIEYLIDEFYKRVKTDELIGFFFTEVIKIDWDRHMPVMYDFWETTLLGKMKYKGNPMLKHIALNKKEPMNPKHFERWLELWETTVLENFGGTKANEAVQRASQIGELMKFMVTQQTTK